MMKPARMKIPLLALAALLPAAPAAQAIDFYIYKLTVKLPVMRVVQLNGVDKIETRTLTNKEIVNIALGRELTHKVDAATEVLSAAAIEEANNMGAPASKWVVFNPRTKAIVPTVAQLTDDNLTLVSPARGALGFGTFNGTLAEVGDPAIGKFFATSTLYGAGTGSGPNGDPFNFVPKATGKSTMVNGRIKFSFTEKVGGTLQTYEGLVIKGTVTGGGTPALVTQ
jgi:hypothetical protein